MLGIFKDTSLPKVRLNSIDPYIYESLLGQEEHQYLYGPKIALKEQVDTQGKMTLYLSASPGKNVGLCIIFFSESGEKLEGKNIPANQFDHVIAPAEAKFFQLALRFFGPGEIKLISLNVGKECDLLKQINHDHKFNYSNLYFNRTFALASGQLSDLPLILIETIFCDTETNLNIIERYLSYFLTSAWMMSRSIYTNFYWIIHISEDKKDIIEEIRRSITSIGLTNKVILNIYQHPPEGYGNEHEINDRLWRPNAVFADRRDALFNRAVESIGGLSQYKDLIIRIGLDDDDFFSPYHLLNVVNLSKKYQHLLATTKNVVVGITRVFISHFLLDKSVEIHEVELNRTMTGCKFSFALMTAPLSPYAITERFEDVINKTIGNAIYVKDNVDFPTFSYNRHGKNYSSASKAVYYKEIFSETTVSSQEEMIKLLISGRCFYNEAK